MKFAATLRKNVYAPWNDQYIDYNKLKKLLKDNQDNGSWTADNESAFVDELANVQLERVHNFIRHVSQQLRDRTSTCERNLEPLAVGIHPEDKQGSKHNKNEDQPSTEPNRHRDKPELSQQERTELLKDVLEELDSITRDTKELERFGRLNFTAVIKATKKHDKLRGNAYKLRPFIDARLAQHSLHTEDASPLLYRLSALYSFVRQSLEGKSKHALSFNESGTGTEGFVSHKFWVHMDNLLELKTIILRRLPVLVYNPQSSKVVEATHRDPTITSIYFDNSTFSLYSNKVNSKPDASSLRLRWYGQLSEKPEIVLEKKVIKEGNASEEIRFPIKAKYINAFLKGHYHMEKSVDKLRRVTSDKKDVDHFKEATENIQEFIRKEKLQPVLRANYTRTAFQIPGDDRVRISLDTRLALIREDALDVDRPCRDPDDWHRRDVDNDNLEFPFKSIRKGEVHIFPYALLEIKTKGLKKYEWIEEIMDSHLVKESPRFSKFVHGVARLFEDNVDTFPFWLSEVDNDIRKEPGKAFDEQQEKKRKAAEDEFAVGSLFGAHASSSFRASVPSPAGSIASTRPVPKLPSTTVHSQSASSALLPTIGSHLSQQIHLQSGKGVGEEVESDEDDTQPSAHRSSASRLASLFPAFSTSKYARRQQNKGKPALDIKDPGVWIKDQGPVRVEAKVWLANQRTYVRWQHISVLLASLSLGLYNAAREGDNVARALAVIYTSIAAFSLAWGYGIYIHRNRMIQKRSGKDFDFVLGPLVVCIGLAIALCSNFAFKYTALSRERRHELHGNMTSTMEQTELRM